MLDVSKIFPLGAVSVNWLGTDLGHTDSGTELSFKTEWLKLQAGKYGKSTVGVARTGIEVQVKMMLIQNDLANIQANANTPFQIFNPVSGSAGVKATFGEVAGKLNSKGTLLLTPYLTQQSQATLFPLTLTQATPMGDPKLLYSGEKIQVWEVLWEACIDEGQIDGALLGTLGNTAVTQGSAPSVTTVVPADAATGVSDTLTSVVWTMSEALNVNTVGNRLSTTPAPNPKAHTVHLFAIPGGSAGSEVTPVSVVLVNNGSSTTITMNLTGSLGASTEYLAVLENAILDQNGNALPTYVSKFTTT